MWKKINSYLNEDTVSMLLGLLIVLVVGWAGFRFLQRQAGRIDVPGISDSQTTSPVPTQKEDGLAQADGKGGEIKEVTPKIESQKMEDGSEVYQVKKGDYLWKLAQTKYGSGYQWKKIAQANKLSHPGVLEVGQKLVIPKAGNEVKVAIKSEEKNTKVIEGESYTVVKGDSLSKIALRAYGDSYAWTKIWQVNKKQIVNPSRIEVGMNIAIPRVGAKDNKVGLSK
jgi:nucleoid-associated protein YgaU